MSTSVAVGFVAGMTLGFLLIACLVCEFWALSLRVDRIEVHLNGELPVPSWIERLRLCWLAVLQSRRDRRDDVGLDEWIDRLHHPGAAALPEPAAHAEQQPAPRPRPDAPATQPSAKVQLEAAFPPAEIADLEEKLAAIRQRTADRIAGGATQRNTPESAGAQ